MSNPLQRIMTPATDSDASDREHERTEHVTEAREMAESAIANWDYLSGEERHGALHEIVHQLEQAGVEN